MTRATPAIKPFTPVWGYWAGGLFCVAALLSLSLGLIPLITAFRAKPIPVLIPGRSAIELRLPGAYVAVTVDKDLSSDDMKRVNDLEYLLTDKDEKESLKVIKIPPRTFATDKKEAQLPLFQFYSDKKGRYIFESRYPFGFEEPKITALLFYADFKYVRQELIAGAAIFLLLAGLGGYFIWKSRSSARLPIAELSQRRQK